MTGEAPALAGTLSDLSVVDVLHLLAASHHTGLLELEGRNGGRIALFEGGITLATSDGGPSLQQVFIGSGVASPESWAEAETATHHGITLTNGFVSAGVDPGRLDQVLYEQVVGAVFELMLPSEDSFAFRPGDPHPIGTRYVYDVDRVLADAERRVDAWKVIAEAIPSTSIVMRLSRTLRTPETTITGDEWRVLARVDGRASIADIIRTLGMSAFAVCGVLHGLLEFGVVEPTDGDQ